MTTKQKLRYAMMCVRRLPTSFLCHPIHTSRMVFRRAAFTITKKFVGRSFVCPITGETIFNSSSLLNSFGIHIIRELDGPWIAALRESVSPVVFDVGSNIGQFRSLVLSTNPTATVHTFDCWKEMARCVPQKTHHRCALTSRHGDVVSMIKQPRFWSSSTSLGYYGGASVRVNTSTLDREWNLIGKPHVSLLKIDIDGGEIESLRGAKQLLNHVDFVLVETGDMGAVKRLCPRRTWTTNNGYDYCGAV